MLHKTNIIKYTYIALFSAFLFNLNANAQEEIATRANLAYKNGKYADAINEYEKLLTKYQSAALYYNLGNAYYKGQDLTSAILYYEKALKLEPNNKNIKHNIDICNSKIIDRIETVPQLFYIRWWKSLVNITGVNEIAYISLGLLALTLTLAAFYVSASTKKKKKTFFILTTILNCFFILSFAVAAQKYYNTKNALQAIVFDKQVSIKASPDDNSKDVFILHEGSKVTLLDEVGNWQEVKISNGTTGWLKASSIKAI